VEEFVEKSAKLERKRFWVRLGALAACFCLLAGMLFMFSNRTPAVPVWENAMFSAQDIADIMKSDTLNATGTQAYQEVHAPSKEYLYANHVPNLKYLDIYQHNEPSVALQEQEFQNFIASFNGKLASALGIQAPLFEKTSVHENYLSVWEEVGKYYFDIHHSLSINRVYVSTSYASGDRPIVLDGETVQIDLRKSDSQIIESLESVKNKLFAIFGVTFQDAKVVRRYSTDSKVECYIDVVFYNASAHPLNAYTSFSQTDYINITFDNVQNHVSESVSDSIISDVSISYNQRRNDVSEEYKSIASAKRISLKEAEALLYKGYTFGGHTCDLCMANNDYVSFEGYDLVGFEYLFDRKQNLRIPFYTFYKEIRQKNNIKIYAKTYVPAIPVSGYEEYFESQLKNHRAE
jgi:hypothetical protein